MLSQAEALARQGKPHYIEIQGASYEGYTVWVNAMVASAGGHILSDDGQRVVLGPAAAKGVSLIGQLARSPAADPSLGVQMEDANRLAFETGKAAFEVNYPFVYPSAQQNAPAIAKQMAWTEYPRVDAKLPSRPPVGGIDLAVSAFSTHQQQAFDAIQCLRDPANQLRNAVKAFATAPGQLPGPRLINGGYPRAGDPRPQRGGVRPKTPAYQSVSIAISTTPCTRRRRRVPATRPAWGPPGRHRIRADPMTAQSAYRGRPGATRHSRGTGGHLLSEGPAPSAARLAPVRPRGRGLAVTAT
jgi:multiple sugar transport system substrate-binding protein